MTRPIQSSLFVAALLACSLPFAASAQVASNLDDLPGSAPARPTGHATRSRRVHHASAAPQHPQTTGAVTPARHPATTTLPAVPLSPPPPVVLPPPFVPVALHPPTPPDPVKAEKDAKSSTTALPNDGLRVVFGPGSAALDGTTLKTVQNYGNTLKEHPEQRALLLAYATVPGDDVSMPRRIALARALAIRSVLIDAGVATTRIYPRAIGRAAQGDTAPADRLDILIQTNPSPAIDPARPANGNTAPHTP